MIDTDFHACELFVKFSALLEIQFHETSEKSTDDSSKGKWWLPLQNLKE